MQKTYIAILIASFSWAVTIQAEDTWPQFRGRNADGIGGGNPPTEWDMESGENVLWKQDIPGLGHSSPIAYGNRIFLTTATSDSTEEPALATGWLGGTGASAEGDDDFWSWQVICLDRRQGDVLWSKTVASGLPQIARHMKATHANCTPATDGKYIVAFFGSEGLYCLDMEGNIVWQRDLGKLHSGPYNSPELEWGFSSSPVIHDNKVIIQCDCLNTGFVAVLDIETGKDLLRIKREDVATWSTPAIIQHEGQTQIVCNGFRQMAGYDFQSGEKLWWLGGGGDVPVPTPLYSNGSILVTNGHGRNPIYCISAHARGDLTPEEEEKEEETETESIQAQEKTPALQWWRPIGGSYMPTPIIVADLLYVCDDNGVLAVHDVKSGDQLYRKRVGGGTYSASAVATGNHLYFSSEKGQIHVVKTGQQFERVATNDMQAIVMATPAIVGDQLLVRTAKQLVCIGARDSALLQSDGE